MKWEVKGADRRTGNDRSLIVEAPNAAAEKLGAMAGILVEAVSPVPQPVPPTAGEQSRRKNPRMDLPTVLPVFASRAQPIGRGDFAGGAATEISDTGEYIFFRDQDALITDSRLVFFGKTFVLANLTSVVMRKVPLGIMEQIGFIVLGVLVVIIGWVAAILNARPMVYATFIIGIGIVIAGGLIVYAAIRYRPKPEFALWVESSSGAVAVLQHRSESYVATLTEAINQAIASSVRVRPGRI